MLQRRRGSAADATAGRFRRKRAGLPRIPGVGKGFRADAAKPPRFHGPACRAHAGQQLFGIFARQGIATAAVEPGRHLAGLAARQPGKTSDQLADGPGAGRL